MTARPHENIKMGGRETNNVVCLALWSQPLSGKWHMYTWPTLGS